jgi:hypothetical protein
MQDRYWLYRRENGVFYLQDKITGRQQSTRTKDDSPAKRLLAGKNQSVEQQAVQEGAAEIVRLTLQDSAVTGRFLETAGEIPW